MGLVFPTSQKGSWVFICRVCPVSYTHLDVYKRQVRKAAKKFGVSKSTVHKDVAERLKYVDPQLYKEVKDILEINKAQRHIRGGMATRMKYKKDEK